MDILQLEHLIAVCEEGTFTRAAERVFRTQSAVSQSIRKLEDEIGTPLFARDMRDVTLTETGKLTLEYARKMVRLRDEAVRQLGALKNLSAGTVSVAAHEAAAVYLLPAAVRYYVTTYPDIRIRIYRSRLDEITRQVLDREVDLGFIKDEAAFHGLESVNVHNDNMILIASPHHPLASRDTVSIRDLGNQPFVMHHVCTNTAQKIIRLFEQHDTRCHIVAELWSFENVKSFVQAEVGVAIVPRLTVTQELEKGQLVEIPIPELKMPRSTYMIYNSGYVSDSARKLIEVVLRFSRNAGHNPGVTRAIAERRLIAGRSHAKSA